MLRKRHYSCYHVVFKIKTMSDMNSSPSLPNYKKLTTLFKKMKSELNPAQTHGLLCGRLCTIPVGKSDPEFDASLMDVEATPQSQQVLSQLYKASYHSLKQFSFEFSLILPGEEADLNTRVEALGLWCQGFLIGTEEIAASLKNSSDPEVVEALSDLSEIAQINFGDIPENEEDETAYIELVEYTRLSVLMIFNAIHNTNPTSEKKGALLH